MWTREGKATGDYRNRSSRTCTVYIIVMIARTKERKCEWSPRVHQTQARQYRSTNPSTATAWRGWSVFFLFTLCPRVGALTANGIAVTCGGCLIFYSVPRFRNASGLFSDTEGKYITMCMHFVSRPRRCQLLCYVLWSRAENQTVNDRLPNDDDDDVPMSV